MVLNYVYVPRSYKGGSVTMPSSFVNNYSRSVPVSHTYAPIVPAVAEATQVPVPVTKQAAEEIEDSNPLGKIFTFISNAATKANETSATNPNFNALMGALAQYITNSVPQRQKSWLQRANDFFHPQPKTAFERGEYLTAAAPFIGKLASAFVPGSGTLVTDGLLSIGKRLGWGWRRAGQLEETAPNIIIKDESTGKTIKLGKKASLTDDVKHIAKKAFKEAIVKGRSNPILSKIYVMRQSMGGFPKLQTFSHMLFLLLNQSRRNSCFSQSFSKENR